MQLRKHVLLLVCVATLIAGTELSYAEEPCALFVWTNAARAPVERYKPNYLIGEGLEDVSMGHIIGTRIRYKWSTQAASCIASSNRYGYFHHTAFDQINCAPDELCYPGVRPARLSERLADVLNVVQFLAIPNIDPTYQLNLNTARASSYLVIDAMGAAPTTTASFYESLVDAYDHVVSQLEAALNVALPPSARTSVLDALCAPDNVARLEELENRCFDNDQFCDLTFLYVTINMCQEYQNGATLDQVLTSATTAKDGLVTERTQLAGERDQIRSLWSQIQALRPSLASLPATCNIQYQFGIAQLPQSDFAAGRYGADLRYLYGDWQWSTFGVNTSTGKYRQYVLDIITLVRDCIGDARYGRLDFRRRQVGSEARDETDAEYYTRVLNQVVEFRRQLAGIEMNYSALIEAHAPLVTDSDINNLKTAVNDTWLRSRNLMANRTTGIGWVLVLMQDFQDVSERLTATQELARQLIAVYQRQFPGVRDAVIGYLIDNTNSVVDQYGEFFSAEKRATLRALLSAAAEQVENDNPTQVIEKLALISNQLQGEFNRLWDANQPLGMIASQLKFIFGDCSSSLAPHPLLTYFGDLPIATRIVQEGNDAPLCVH